MRRVPSALMLVWIMAGVAGAQPSDSSTLAEQLFNEARELIKANRWAEACPKFEASLRYDPVLGTRLNLATCYEQIGKLASAWGLYRESIELAKKAGDVKRRSYAQKQAAALEPRLPRLSLTVPARRPEGLVVNRDGRPIDEGALGVGLFVDPGEHEITAAAPGFAPFARTITLAEGKTASLAIPELEPLPAAPAAAAVVPSPVAPHVVARAPAVAPSRTRTYVAIGIGAVGVVGVGTGLVLGARARSTYGEATALCGPDLVCGTDNYARGNHLVHDARSIATVSTVLVAAGAAAMVGGAVLWLTAPRPREVARAGIVPVVHDGGAGFAVAGRF